MEFVKHAAIMNVGSWVALICQEPSHRSRRVADGIDMLCMLCRAAPCMHVYSRTKEDWHELFRVGL